VRILAASVAASDALFTQRTAGARRSHNRRQDDRVGSTYYVIERPRRCYRLYGLIGKAKHQAKRVGFTELLIESDRFAEPGDGRNEEGRHRLSGRWCAARLSRSPRPYGARRPRPSCVSAVRSLPARRSTHVVAVMIATRPDLIRPQEDKSPDQLAFDSTFSLNASHFFLLSAWCSWILAFKASIPSWKEAFSADTTSA
jgi:hypothetical protein